jgi:NADH-quinone oxidoreductase subunit E
VPCLGDCDKAPTMMVGDTQYRNLTPEKIDQIIADHKARA